MLKNNTSWDNIKNIKDTKKVVFLTSTYVYISNSSFLFEDDDEVQYSMITYSDLCKNMIINKTYNVIEYLPNVGPDGRFRLDNGQIYPKELFLPLDVWRNQQIDNVLNCNK